MAWLGVFSVSKLNSTLMRKYDGPLETAEITKGGIKEFYHIPRLRGKIYAIKILSTKV